MSARWSGGYGFGFGGGISSMVKKLIIANVAVFLFEWLFRIQLAGIFGLVPVLFWKGYLWQTVTYMFLHGGWMHLFFNMFVLWMFGSPLEAVWGPKRFLNYYFITGIGAGLINAIVTPNSPIPTVGASGAIYGLLLAFGMLFPNQLIFIYFLFPIKAKYFVIIMGAIELFTALGQPNSPIAHFAHLGGMLFGLVYLKGFTLKRSLSRWTSGIEVKKKIHVAWDREREMEKLRKEVDDLLDKINRNGIASLTKREISRLKEASRKLKEWENQGR